MIKLDLDDPQCRARFSALHQHRTHGAALPPLKLEMEDVDISKITCESRELDEDRPIQIASLHLEEEFASDGWETSSDEDSDFEGD